MGQVGPVISLPSAPFVYGLVDARSAGQALMNAVNQPINAIPVLTRDGPHAGKDSVFPRLA